MHWRCSTANLLTAKSLKKRRRDRCAGVSGTKFGTMKAHLFFPPFPMPVGRHPNNLAALDGTEIPSQPALRGQEDLTHRISHLPLEPGIASGNWKLITAAGVKGELWWQR